jgi:ribosomal protein L14
MIQMRTWLTVADNSGARKLMCILPVGGDVGLKAGLGDIITASVKEATPESQVKQGTVVKAVIVRMRKERRRRDGTTPASQSARVCLARWLANCAKRNLPRLFPWLRRFGKQWHSLTIERSAAPSAFARATRCA